MWRIASAFLGLVLLATHSEADEATEIQALKKQVEQLQRTVEQLQQTIHTIQTNAMTRDEQRQQPTEAVQQPANQTGGTDQASPLDQALKEAGIRTEDTRNHHQPIQPTQPASPTGVSTQRLLDLSFVPTLFMGSSTERDETLQTLQGGGHDPHKRGFTLAAGELGLVGVVDPYFRAQAYISTFIDAISGETGIELEEAFLTTQALPYGLQIELGHFLSEFGQINPRHPHQWDWNDQPIINTRLFGGDGLRAPGFRFGWLLPTPETFFSELHLGMQNANGEQMTSFLGGRHQHGGGDEHHSEDEHATIEGSQIGNRPALGRDTKALRDFVYLARWNSSWEVRDDLGVVLGFSGLYGPNDTGPRGDTWIYGADMKWRWRPTNSFRGWPFVLWQTEIMQRDFRADHFMHQDEDGEIVTLPARSLHDWGFYSQLLYGFRHGWAAGLRYEYAGGSGQSLDGRKNDPFRADRQRFSPLLAFHPSEFTRIRLQYNLDHANHLTNGKNAHSVWLSFQWLYGPHPPHEY